MIVLKTPVLIVAVSLALITAWLTIFSLQWTEPLFKSLWLRPALLIDVKSQVGFAVLVFIFSFSMVGTWLWLWMKVLGVFRVDPVKRLVVTCCFWCVMLLLDMVIRFRIAEVWGHRFSLEAATAAVETPWQLALSVWRWYRSDVLLCLYGTLGIVILGVGADILIGRLFRKPSPDVLHSRGFSISLAASTVVAILTVTVFLNRWPAAISLITRTSVGYPYVELASVATDFDGDGWGYFDIPPDTKPFDNRCRPFAVDIPNDGIDENLLGGDLQFDLFTENPDNSAIAQVEWPDLTFVRKPNVVVVFMESVRFDSISKKIDGQMVMPAFQRLIQEGALAPQYAFSSQGYTFSSVMQFLYGGFHSAGSTVFDDFQNNDYETAIFSGYDLKEEKFDAHMSADVVFDPTRAPGQMGTFHTTPARLLVDQIDAYLASKSKKKDTRPFFLWSFFVDPHFPYKQVNQPVLCDHHVATSDIRPSNKDAVMRSYYDQVYHVDAAAARVMTSLRKHGVARNTIVLFVSDHGESLYDDGNTIGHGIAINDVMTHLLMVVVNSPVDVPDVLSHHHIRGLLRDMLTQPVAPTPALKPLPERQLLQYVGNLRYPAEIGVFSVAEGRLIYNLRKNIISDHKANASVWFDEKNHDSQLNRRGLSLIQKWEYQLYLKGTAQTNRDSQVADKAPPSHSTEQM
ncbi:MAG: sulfatase-like hydrolase/transferase [Deltaproteobacteria bacterium]|nr:sulfatase-like hydrolase/transferase [Deltaproteobacteria bacterium]